VIEVALPNLERGMAKQSTFAANQSIMSHHRAWGNFPGRPSGLLTPQGFDAAIKPRWRDTVGYAPCFY